MVVAQFRTQPGPRAESLSESNSGDSGFGGSAATASVAAAVTIRPGPLLLPATEGSRPGYHAASGGPLLAEARVSETRSLAPSKMPVPLRLPVPVFSGQMISRMLTELASGGAGS